MIPRERLPQVANVLGLPAGLEQQLGIGPVQPQPMQAPAAPAPVLAAPPAPPRPVPAPATAPGPLPPGAPIMSTDPMMGGESPLPPTPAPQPAAPPAPPELQYRPGSYSPGGWRGDSRSTTGVAGQAPLIEAYDAATADAVRANARAVQAQAAIAAQEQAAGDALRDIQQERAEALQAKAQERQAKLDAAQAHVDEQVSRYESEAGDPPEGQEGAMIGLAIGQGLAHLGAILSGRPADADFVTPFVNRRIQQQRAALAKLGGNIENAKGVVADMRKRGFEQADAEKLAEAVYLQRAAAEGEKRLAGIREPAKRAAAAQMVAQYNQKALENRLEVGAKYGEKYTAAEKYQAGSTSGGSYVLNGVPVKSIGGALQLKKLMGTDSETQLQQRALDIKAAEAGIGPDGAPDKRTVVDPQGRPMQFSTEKEAETYRLRFDAAQTMRNQVARLEDIDAQFNAGKITALEANTRTKAIVGTVRAAIKRGVRGETDAISDGERAVLSDEFPVPTYGAGVVGAATKAAGDVWAGVDRNKVFLQGLRQATEEAARDAAKLANERARLREEGRGGRGDPARNLDLRPRR